MPNEAFVDTTRTLFIVDKDAFVHDTEPNDAVFEIILVNEAFTELMFDTHALTNEALLPLITEFICEADN